MTTDTEAFAANLQKAADDPRVLAQLQRDFERNIAAFVTINNSLPPAAVTFRAGFLSGYLYAHGTPNPIGGNGDPDNDGADDPSDRHAAAPPPPDAFIGVA